jgi:hypothetical protein
MQARLKKNLFLALFDGPDPSATTGSRPLTTTPLQALFALNHPLVHNSAEAIARRTAEHTPKEHRVTATYRMLFQRPPAEPERAAAEQFLASYAQALGSIGSTPGTTPPEAWTALTRSLLCSNELLFVD